MGMQGQSETIQVGLEEEVSEISLTDSSGPSLQASISMLSI